MKKMFLVCMMCLLLSTISTGCNNSLEDFKLSEIDFISKGKTSLESLKIDDDTSENFPEVDSNLENISKLLQDGILSVENLLDSHLDLNDIEKLLEDSGLSKEDLSGLDRKDILEFLQDSEIAMEDLSDLDISLEDIDKLFSDKLFSDKDLSIKDFLSSDGDSEISSNLLNGINELLDNYYD